MSGHLNAGSDELLSVAELDELISMLDHVRSVTSRDKGLLEVAPWPQFARHLRCMTPQSWGSRMEARMRDVHGWVKVPASSGRGDVVDVDGLFHEVKATMITPSNPVANFVQIRPHHDVDGYHLFVVDVEYMVFHYWLSKQDMADELAAGSGLAHGTIAAGSSENSEYAIRFRWMSDFDRRDRWDERFLVHTPAPGGLCCARVAPLLPRV